MSFSALGLSEPLVKAVADHGYDTPTPLQLQANTSTVKGYGLAF